MNTSFHIKPSPTFFFFSLFSLLLNTPPASAIIPLLHRNFVIWTGDSDATLKPTFRGTINNSGGPVVALSTAPEAAEPEPQPIRDTQLNIFFQPPEDNLLQFFMIDDISEETAEDAPKNRIEDHGVKVWQNYVGSYDAFYLEGWLEQGLTAQTILSGLPSDTHIWVNMPQLCENMVPGLTQSIGPVFIVCNLTQREGRIAIEVRPVSTDDWKGKIMIILTPDNNRIDMIIVKTPEGQTIAVQLFEYGDHHLIDNLNSSAQPMNPALLLSTFLALFFSKKASASP